MKKLISCRHGDFNFDPTTGEYRINRDGRTQIERLAQAIKRRIGDSSTTLISSKAPRAIDSAEIIRDYLGLPKFEVIAYLWAANDTPKDIYHYWKDRDLTKLANLIEPRSDSDCLIVVSHHGPAEDIVREVKRLNGIAGKIRELDYGGAACLDLELKEYMLLQ
ncbi:histidine phosphatase family protein [Candidatus Woesearchaeota archaeon]|nr:histidine phosphatase family protein [Candidatus Woesearchaeota archaeon]